MSTKQTKYYVALVNNDTNVAKIRTFTAQNREKLKNEIVNNVEVNYSVYKLKGCSVDEVFDILKVEIGNNNLIKDVSRDATETPVCMEITL